MARLALIPTAFLAVVLAYGPQAWAQSSLAEPGTPGSAKSVVRLDLRRAAAAIAAVPPNGRPEVRMTVRQLGRSRLDRHRVLIGALAGFGVGAVVGLASSACRRAPGAEDYCGVSVLLYGAAGAGVGALIGYRITP